MNRIFTLLAVLLASGGAALAVTETFTFNALNLAVPDGDPAGRASTKTVNSTIASIDTVTLTASLSGSYNGDLYAYVTHHSGISILLNRSGKTAANLFGYDDDGFSVTFDDAAPADIHAYRNIVTPAPGLRLSGNWQPDARAIDPSLVTDLSPRSAFLSSFDNGHASGDWTLFIADMTTGDTHTLESWSLTVTGTVPEPGTAVLAMAGGTLALALRRRRQAASPANGELAKLPQWS